MAQAIRYGRTGAVSVWLDMDRAVSSHLKLLRALNKIAGGSGIDLIISDVDASAKSAKLPPLWPADGIIALDAYRTVELLRADPWNDTIPVVILGDITFTNSGAISWNTYGTAKKVVESMFDKGRKRVVHLCPASAVNVFEHDIRLRAYRTVMAERKEEAEVIVVEGDTIQDAERAFLSHLDSNPAPDERSAGALRGHGRFRKGSPHCRGHCRVGDGRPPRIGEFPNSHLNDAHAAV